MNPQDPLAAGLLRMLQSQRGARAARLRAIVATPITAVEEPLARTLQGSRMGFHDMMSEGGGTAVLRELVTGCESRVVIV